MDGGFDVFEFNKNRYYHEDMNSERFEKWFIDVLPRLEDNCVIIMDNAPYHSRKAEKIPNNSWKKQTIIDWLLSKNIAFEDTLLKTELLQLVRQNKNEYDKYAVDELAKADNKSILRLPPYHCELNPIKLIWAQVKNFIAKENKTFNMSHLKDLCWKVLAELALKNGKIAFNMVQMK